NHRWPHFLRAQIAHFLDLQKLKERIGVCNGYQFSPFPSCQLTRREPKNPEQICSTVAVHGYRERSAHIILNIRANWQVESRLSRNLKRQLAHAPVQSMSPKCIRQGTLSIISVTCF